MGEFGSPSTNPGERPATLEERGLSWDVLSASGLSPVERRWVGDFVRALVDIEQQPPGTPPDWRIAAYATAAVERFLDPERPELRETIFSHLVRNKNRKHPVSPPYAVSILRIATQHVLMEAEKRGLQTRYSWPHEYLLPEAWHHVWDVIEHAPDMATEFHNDLLNRDVQSNVPQRYVSLLLVILINRLSQGRLNEDIMLADFGCSQNWGNTKIVSNSPFSPVTVMKPTEIPGIGHVRDSESTRILNVLLRSERHKSNVSYAMGLDRVSVYDETARSWVKSSSRYPREFIVPELEAEYSFLDQEQPTEVDFVKVNVASENMFKEAGLAPHVFDLGFMATTLYMMSEEEQKQAFKNMQTAVKPDGYIVRQDFVDASRSRGGAFVTTSDIYKKKWRYYTAVTDMKLVHEYHEILRKAEAGKRRRKPRSPSEIRDEALKRGTDIYFIFEDGRCQNLMLGPALSRKLGKIVARNAINGF